MQVINFLVALSPIVVVLVGILCFKQSAKRVAPIALVWTLFLGFTYFNVTGATFAQNVAVFDALIWKGLKEGLKIVVMVFGAFVILNILRETGAIEDVKATIARISDDRRVQVVIIGLMLPIFLEGAAGAGAPAAIAAPFLMALGFDPITSIAVALLGDATPCSWGGAGLTTINGGAALVDGGREYRGAELRHGGSHPHVRRAGHSLHYGVYDVRQEGLQGHRAVSAFRRCDHRRR